MGCDRINSVALHTFGILFLLLAGCHEEVKHVPARQGDADPARPVTPGLKSPPPTDSGDRAASIEFAAVARQAGIDFTYYGSPSPELYMLEQNGGGVALFDFDGDGQLDVYLSNGSHFDRPAEQIGACHRLYRAIQQPGQPLSFEDVTRPAGVRAFGFGMGVAAGDYNNDGFVDLYVAAYGQNRLWENNGDGTFTEATLQADVGDESWASSAAFADLDADGDLDLYVVNYVEHRQHDKLCRLSVEGQTIPIPCGPMGRRGLPDLLYENLGDGRFRDVSQTASIAVEETGKGLAVQIVDLDQDGLLDVYVANDTTENFLFRNRGALEFEEIGLASGVAVSEDGKPQSSMGIACADYDQNGRLDLFVTNFENAVNDLYQNEKLSGFRAWNSHLGLDTTARPMLSFGTVFADFDLDQWPDLFVANGHIWDLTGAGNNFAYEMHPQLYQNREGTRFRDISRESGKYFRSQYLGRAVAAGDIDNDGDTDLLVAHLQRPYELLRNDTPAAGGSVRLKLVGVQSARQALGARVEIVCNGKRFVGHVPSGGSFQSSSDERVLFSTGSAKQLDHVTVHWGPGTIEDWSDLDLTSEILLVEGTGQTIHSGDRSVHAKTAGHSEQARIRQHPMGSQFRQLNARKETEPLRGQIIDTVQRH